MLISCAVTAQLICAFVFAYAYSLSFYAAAHSIHVTEMAAMHKNDTCTVRIEGTGIGTIEFEPVHEKSNNLGFDQV